MFSIIIPTMQKNVKVLNMLLDELVSDKYVDEIIIIDNSLLGISYKSDKIKVITPTENLYVNPAWNLGVKNAKNEFVGVLNDDLIFPKKFIGNVYEFLKKEIDVGFVGLDTIPKTDDVNFSDYPKDAELVFNLVNVRPTCWGSAFFFKKSNYIIIPKELKVWCGDDFLFYKSLDNAKKNYAISNSNIMHLHSFTSDRKEFNIIKYQDQLYYKEINSKYNLMEIPHYTLLQKIFSIKNNYSNNVKHKTICILGLKISIRYKQKVNFFKLHKNFVDLEKQFKCKKVINIVFMVSLASMFPAKPFLDYLLSKSSRYNVKILIVPDFRFGIEKTRKFQDECYNEFSKQYSKDIIIQSPIDECLDDIDMSKICDILFCSLPYDVSHKKYNLENLIKENILLAMINYGVYILPKFAKVSLSHKRLGYFKYLFYETPYTFNMFKKYSIVKGINGILSGYCKMDGYKECPSIKNHKTIIIAPHHSVSGGYNDILSLSNFCKYADFFLKLPQMYPNIDWIFRPHPALFPLLEQDRFWGKGKVDSYINKMKQYSNVRYSVEGCYFEDFKESDGIIQDCESFLFEYFYTGKPQCYMLKNNINNKKKFGEFGSKLLGYCYTAYSEQDILNFINTVILQEQDIKKDARVNFARKEVMINYPNVSEFIFNYFEKIYGGDIL